MKKIAVNYRDFRLSKINQPEYSHLKLLAGWLIYFAMYFLTENLIPAEICHPVHMWIDDMIPFCEIFLIPYVFWYGLLIYSLLYFALYNVDSFKKLQIFIIYTQVVAMAIYIIYPNRQDLRPTEFPRDNIFTQIIGFLYRFDTNTGVCPSLHVAYSFAMLSVWLKEKGISILKKIRILLYVILICLATMFIKQHSAVDFFTAVGMCFIGEILIYGKSYWLPKIHKKKIITAE